MAVTGELGRYRYLSKLGSGGMATVDLAEDTVLGRKVALKKVSGTSDPRGMSRLRREALAGASLSHPNLVSIYNVVTTDDDHLIVVMEYVEGRTLRETLNQRRRLPVAEVLRVLSGVGAGLDAIHERGIVHRDVKPSNILLGEDGSVKVADLGIAAVPDRTRLTTSGSVLGSLSYMAPEQLADTPSTPAIDVYALAAVAYEMLSGEKARRETNPVMLAHAISTQPPPDLRNAWSQAPPAAAELLIRAMSRDRHRRPSSAGELVAALRRALEPEVTAPVMVPPPPVPGGRPVRRSAGTPRTVVPARVAEPRRPGAVDPPVVARRSRWAWVTAALLGAVALAVVLAVGLRSGGNQPGAPARSTPARSTPARSTPATGGGAGRTHGAAASPSASTSTSTSASASGTGAGATSTGTSPPGPAGSVATPQAAVETFYGDAAAHRYADAWALADPSFRAQLGGLQSFEAGQAADRSITFNAARVVSRSGSGATVAVQTTSVRSTGTQHCSGSVDVVRAGAGWQLHQIAINCS